MCVHKNDIRRSINISMKPKPNNSYPYLCPRVTTDSFINFKNLVKSVDLLDSPTLKLILNAIKTKEAIIHRIVPIIPNRSEIRRQVSTMRQSSSTTHKTFLGIFGLFYSPFLIICLSCCIWLFNSVRDFYHWYGHNNESTHYY